jgi:hypothetical protein
MRTACLCLLLVAAPALADAIDVSLTSRVPRGKVPSLQVHILEPIAGFKVALTRNDGKTLEVKGGGKPGVVRTVDLEQPEGRFHWSGALTINLPDGTTGAMDLDFDAEVQGPLKLQVDKRTDVDFERRQIFFTLNHPAGKVHLKVLVETGVIAFEDDVPFNGEPPGTRLQVGWPKTFDRALLVDVRAFDTAGICAPTSTRRWTSATERSARRWRGTASSRRCASTSPGTPTPSAAPRPTARSRSTAPGPSARTSARRA